MREPEIASQKMPPARLKTRPEYLRVAKGRRLRTPCFTLQMMVQPRHAEQQDTAARQPPRFGFTATKKLGGAVVRNRIRRRLKEALRHVAALSARPGHDYVIVAQPAALTEDFARLQERFSQAFADIHAAPRPRARSPRKD